MPCSNTYLRDGWAPHRHHVARHLVQVSADELQRLWAHKAVDQVNTVQQRRHGSSKCAKVVGNGLQDKACVSYVQHKEDGQADRASYTTLHCRNPGLHVFVAVRD